MWWMFQRSLRSLSQILLSVWLGMLLMWSSWAAMPAPAAAAIRQLEEKPGQVVYQSRHSVTDQYNNRWQTVAFNRVRPDGSTSFFVRLSGFPDSVDIDRSQPITLRDPMGDVWQAADASEQMFTDASSRKGHIGQYDLLPVVNALDPVLPIEIELPTLDSGTIKLSIQPTAIQEWKTVADRR